MRRLSPSLLALKLDRAHKPADACSLRKPGRKGRQFVPWGSLKRPQPCQPLDISLARPLSVPWPQNGKIIHMYILSHRVVDHGYSRNRQKKKCTRNLIFPVQWSRNHWAHLASQPLPVTGGSKCQKPRPLVLEAALQELQKEAGTQEYLSAVRVLFTLAWVWVWP